MADWDKPNDRDCGQAATQDPYADLQEEREGYHAPRDWSLENLRMRYCAGSREIQENCQTLKEEAQWVSEDGENLDQSTRTEKRSGDETR